MEIVPREMHYARSRLDCRNDRSISTKNAAWERGFVDLNILNIYHTSTDELTSNALTKRVTAEEQQWSTDDIRGLHHHEVPTTSIISVPIRQRDHMELWPVIPCLATNP